MNIDVSIIVPCYNVESYVDNCLEALTAQTLHQMEIICVNDGSTDGTLSRLQIWAQQFPHIRIIDQSNFGVSMARNAGLEISRGSYVGFVDPDDLVEKDMFACLFQNAVENQADVAVCGYTAFSDKTGAVLEEESWSPDTMFYPEEHVEKFRRGSIWSRCVGPVCNKLIRRSVLEEHYVRFIPGLKEGEDMAFLLMLLPFAPRLLTMGNRFYHYRRERAGSATYGRNILLNDYRMDLLNMNAVTRFWQEKGLWTAEVKYGLIDYYMEFLRRHFIMQEGAFFKASKEDRVSLLKKWNEWLELIGGENSLERLGKWDRTFCFLLRKFPLNWNKAAFWQCQLMSFCKGRRGAYYTLRKQLLDLARV